MRIAATIAWVLAVGYWDGSQGEHFPTHDPCGNNAADHIALPDPLGAVFIRREMP